MVGVRAGQVNLKPHLSGSLHDNDHAKRYSGFKPQALDSTDGLGLEACILLGWSMQASLILSRHQTGTSIAGLFSQR
jgi:hypothetical protein